MTPVLLSFLLVSGDGRDPAKEWLVDNAPVVIGAATGSLAGAALGAGVVAAVASTCIESDIRCPWGGQDGGEAIGAMFMMPIAAVGLGLVGGVVGAAVGWAIDDGAVVREE